MDALRNRWRAFAGQLGIEMKAADQSFDELVRRYSLPQRHYHTLTGHIYACIMELDSVCGTKIPLGVEAALWVHDAHYNPRSHDNETRSKEWMQNLFRKMWIPETFIDEVAALIAVTTHVALPHELIFGINGEKRSYDYLLDTHAEIVADVDLSVLGKSEMQFDEYERGVREEYVFVPEITFREKRAEILERFLQRKSIYNHRIFQEKYEKQARKNLARSIERLRTRVTP